MVGDKATAAVAAPIAIVRDLIPAQAPLAVMSTQEQARHVQQGC